MTKPSTSSISDMLATISLPSRTSAEGETSHPLGGEFDFEEPDDIFRMDPRQITLEGKYVRRWFEDAEFTDFCKAVRENGDIGQPIGIRRVGAGAEQRFVLVYGMRRLKAALAAELPLVPVRDYGQITEDESVVLQMQENELRAEPHPVDTAYGYWLMVEAGRTQQEIAKDHGKDKGYISVMVRAGEAIALLSEEERIQLYTSPDVTVRAFQQLVKISDVHARRDELLRLAKGQPTPVKQATGAAKAVQEAFFHARQHRDGRSFRVRWRDAELRQDPCGFVAKLSGEVATELEHLARRLEVLGTPEANAAAEAARRTQTALRAQQEQGRGEAV